ncbi:MAG TPA: HTH domain-containing protein [Campylobacterales bacterium]|nr:HTH domain-containing protein [Campylobacterales bacterium]
MGYLRLLIGIENFINQPVKATIIAEHFNVTQRTIERWIKQLKDEEQIEFRGASKSGGYFAK